MREREMGYQKLFGSGSGSTPGLRRHRSLCPFHAFFGLCRVCIPVSEVFVVVLSRTSFHSSLSPPTPLVSLPSYSRWRATGKLRRCWRRRRPGGCVEEAATAARRREGPGGGGGLSEGLEPRGLTSTRGHKRRTETSLVRATFHPPAPQSAQLLTWGGWVLQHPPTLLPPCGRQSHIQHHGQLPGALISSSSRQHKPLWNLHRVYRTVPVHPAAQDLSSRCDGSSASSGEIP
uniref:Macaca fascicularis brain cDNA clone: QbsB-10911, similar to human transcriptional activator of the c-fos promoter (CROC4), mRNA, RefSeq: NM_006365.1 n=1 Tax=Macaca fascicularis TaxID=9541 RepID=I7GM73_MACFA|nr:unnamed protein product [Macaca fascicularis]